MPIINKYPVKPFEAVLAYTRFRNGQIVPMSHPDYKSPRVKREWRFEGTHTIKLADGTTIERSGGYWPNMERGYNPVPKRKTL